MSDVSEVLDLQTNVDDTSLPRKDYARKKTRILLMLLGYSALTGIFVVVGFFFNPNDKPNPMNIVIHVPTIALILWWCLVDAEQHDHAIGKIMRICLILLTFIAFPIYIFQTRGIGGFKTLVLAALFFAAMTACSVVTAGVTVGLGLLGGFVSPTMFE